MLAVQVSGYTKPCVPNTGGISRVWVFDPADLDYTQGASPNNSYTAVALIGGATILGGSGFFAIGFDYLSGQYKAPQSVKGSSIKFAHELSLHLPSLDNDLTNFMLTMMNALACASLGFVIEQNNGHILVIGEQSVNGETIPLFRIQMDGTSVDSGKAFDDENGATVMFKGDYSRPAYEFTGGIDAIIALQGTPIF